MANPRQNKKRVITPESVKLTFLAVIQPETNSANQAETQESSRIREQSDRGELEQEGNS